MLRDKRNSYFFIVNGLCWVFDNSYTLQKEINKFLFYESSVLFSTDE